MLDNRLPPLVHTITLSIALIASYLFISTPILARYSLQAVAMVVLLFFLTKLLNQQKFHHLIPQHASLEVALVTFIFSLLIGATGNTDSIFYPLTYIYLFLLVFSTYTQTAIIATLGLMLHQYLLMPTTTYVDIFDIISLPIVLIFFIFAKQQHEELIREHQELEREAQDLDQFESQVQTLGDQLAITQSELNRSSEQLEQLHQLLQEIHSELEQLIDSVENTTQKRRALKLQVIIEDKLGVAIK